MKRLYRHPGEGRGPDGVSSLDTGRSSSRAPPQAASKGGFDGWVAMAFACLLAACAPESRPTTGVDLQVYPTARGMPADVQRFIVQWEDCWHWLGEPPWDEERRREVEHAIRDVCPGVDALGRQIRALHAGNPEILARLREYEPLGQ
jgi:hypothetical protein